MRWLELTWTQLRDLDRKRTVPILPVGAVEAHGPHLPLGTDGIIADAMAEAALVPLRVRGFQGVILPPLDFTVARFGAGFPGTLNFQASSVQAVLGDLLEILAYQGFTMLAIANAHLDPEHLASLQAALVDSPLRVAYPQITRRSLAERLTEEFRSGACHAGQYEGSVVLARRPELVQSDVAASLPDIGASLVDAIRENKRSFGEAGGPEAYFGSPRQATAEEGEETIRTLGEMLAEAVAELSV
jgi:creatinine amidohydrolase